ncbi:MAG: hypothetical protein NZ942_02885 [Candidatus Aenigmarchaeota archaeon]|nr:hypothetical protein [Candidatus Aenigmarchaeota archaeon]
MTFEDYVEEQSKFLLDRKTFFEMHEKGLAPLNFDADDKKQAKKIARILKRMFKGKRYCILVRRSPSKKGFHFTIFKDGKQLFLEKNKVLRIRKKVGDCYGRLECDILRSKFNLPIGILFNHKAKFGKKFKFATRWVDLRKVENKFFR